MLTDCEVRLVFEHGGQEYEVRRVDHGARITRPTPSCSVGDLQLATGTTEVDAEIRQLLQMDLQVFRASVFAEQKQLDAFSSMRKGERKEMALRLLGIKPVDDARRPAARKEARAKDERRRSWPARSPTSPTLESAAEGAQEAAAEAEDVAKVAAERARRPQRRADEAAAKRVRERRRGAPARRDS